MSTTAVVIFVAVPIVSTVVAVSSAIVAGRADSRVAQWEDERRARGTLYPHE